jgi:hypothetical protein
MTRSRSTTRRSAPHTPIVGTFLFLLAVVLAVAPLPLLARSLGVVLGSYAAFTFAGLPFAFAAALLAPVAGLLTGGEAWLVLLPLMLVSGLLALLGLDYAWRLPALVVSPLLYVLPQLIVWQLSQRALFAVALPWSPSALVWLGLHALAALLGVAGALWWRRDGASPRRR